MTVLSDRRNSKAASAGAIAKNAPLVPWKWLSKTVVPFWVGIKATVWTDIGFLYCRNVWIYVYNWRGHVCHLGLMQVSCNFSCVDVVVIIKKVDHQAVKLKNAWIHSFVSDLKWCPVSNYTSTVTVWIYLQCVLAMPFFRFCTVLGLTEKPRTCPGDNLCKHNRVSDEYKPLSFWSWHIFCVLYKINSFRLLVTAVFHDTVIIFITQIHYIKLWLYNSKICLNASTLYFTGFLQFPE